MAEILHDLHDQAVVPSAYAGRGLMVHSADWTAPMVTAFDAAQEKRAHYELVRRFGDGVPNLERAAASARSSLALGPKRKSNRAELRNPHVQRVSQQRFMGNLLKLGEYAKLIPSRQKPPN